MNWLQIASVFGLFVVVQTQDYEFFIDPYNADDSFNVDCGDTTDHQMLIVFRGNAYAVFAPNLPGCVASETEPAHFQISAFADATCTPDKAYGLEVYSLELVVQKGNVRRHDDPLHMVTCSYELGGGSVSSAKETEDSAWSRCLSDVKNRNINSSQIGSYIQLVAFMTPVGDEVSFRMLNCRAFSSETGVYAEHNILFEGCGDDSVIRRDRGFRTTSFTDDSGNTLRMARSVFFRSFSLLSNTRLQFECAYLITKDTSSDGPSCKRSPAALNKPRRKKRSVASEFNLPYVRTELIDLTLETGAVNDNAITYTIRTNQETDDHRPYNSKLLGNLSMATLSLDGLLRHPLVLDLLITCCLLVAFMVVAGIILLITRSRICHSHRVYDQSPPGYTPDSIYTPDSSTCSKT